MTELNDTDYCEGGINVCHLLKNKAKKCCRVDTIKSTLPLLNWLPLYKVKFLPQDFLAGLTVGLTAIPQSIAYGTVAGLPPVYGLYSAFMGCFAYVIFGTCKDISVGPTAIMALMVQPYVKSGSVDYAILTCFLIGCIITLMGILNLGVLVQFISAPVTIGFTMAAGITIASSQINHLFGIKGASSDIIGSWKYLFTHYKDISLNDTLLGIFTLAILILMRKIQEIPWQYKTLTKYVSLARNALAVFIGILLCYCMSQKNSTPFEVSGEITAGLPPLKWPPFSTIVNGTEISPKQMISNLGTSLVFIPIISILESIAVAKAFSKGKIVKATQEMIALGMCNILSSFVSSMPITGSFTRTAINNSSGVLTPLGGIITGALVLMTLAFLTRPFYYLPKATLAAVIIAAMISMMGYDKVIQIWRAKKIDMIPFAITLLVCLFWSLEYGIICGIIVNLVFILYPNTRPEIRITREKVNNTIVGIVSVQESLSYASAEYLKARILKFITNKENAIDSIIITGVTKSIDSTVALNIISLKDDLLIQNCEMLCWNWNADAVAVICRLQDDTCRMFHFSKTLEEILSISTQARQCNVTP